MSEISVEKAGAGEIKEKMKKLQNKFEMTLIQVNNAIIVANEKIGKLSQRFGRIISKFDKMDNKNTVFLRWLQDYIGLKNNIKELGSAVWSGKRQKNYQIL